MGCSVRFTVHNSRVQGARAPYAGWHSWHGLFGTRRKEHAVVTVRRAATLLATSNQWLLHNNEKPLFTTHTALTH